MGAGVRPLSLQRGRGRAEGGGVMKSTMLSNIRRAVPRAFAGLLLTLSAAGLTARAQGFQPQEVVGPSGFVTLDGPRPSPTGKYDEYGRVGHCDETARLDNFAITLQNEPAAKGYVMIYLGRDHLPARTHGILARAADYLVTTRGLSPERVQVVNAGYREQQTTE